MVISFKMSSLLKEGTLVHTNEEGHIGWIVRIKTLHKDAVSIRMTFTENQNAASFVINKKDIMFKNGEIHLCI